MMLNKRQSSILDILAHSGDVAVQNLAGRFCVSEMTIRRDLVLLEKQGELTRTHGGAVLSKPGVIEFAFSRKGKENAAEKQAIAKEVLNLIHPGMTVTLDTGTTTLEVAKRLTGIKPLTVLTSSLPIASTLYAYDHIELVLLGGTARKGNPDLSGWLTEENLKRFRVNLAVLGSDGLMPDGLFTTDMNVARVSQAIIQGAERIILVADHSKIGKTSFVKFAEWDAVDRLITDSKVSPAARKWLKKKMVELTYVKI